MRVLHAALMANFEPGVMRQMEWENSAARELGLAWESRLYCPVRSESEAGSCVVPARGVGVSATTSVIERARRWLKLRKGYYDWLKEESVKYDLLMLRHSMADPFRVAFVSSSKIPVLSVHHTMELTELAGRRGLQGTAKAMIERVVGRRSIACVSGVVGVTDEIRRYELARAGVDLPSFVYPNGIDLASFDYELGSARGALRPEVLFVAGHFSHWHGLDLLLDSVENSGSDFVLHLVGRLSKADRARAERDRRVVCHGLLGKDEIRSITQKCHVGLSSFALQRMGMEEACTLKVREYLAAGLAVFAGYRDVFPSDFRFYRNGHASIEEILEYAREISDCDRADVASAASPYISKKCILDRFYRDLVSADLLSGRR